jgi:predicted transposase/invertase (TIGR01784 family)
VIIKITNFAAKIIANMDEDIKNNEERLNPLNDYLFMKYMSEKGDEVQLMAFINAVIHKTGRAKITTIRILENRLLSADIIGDKSSILDLRGEMSDGTRVNIEVQLRNAHNMDKRSLFYWSREYVEGIKAGEKYQDLPNVITINILGKGFLPTDEAHSSFHIRDDIHSECVLTDALEMHFIDMAKFRRMKQKDIVHNELHRWLTFFDKDTSNETIKKIIDMDTAIKRADEKIKVVTQDRDTLHAYRMREMAIYDYNSGMKAAREEGITIGEKNAKFAFALTLKHKGFSIEDIVEYSMLTKQEVINLFTEHGLI